MALKFEKSISDPLYGTIPLTGDELKIINTSAFQRLRHVQNLGLAYLVFPSAIYSRFAHSLGACHTIGQMLELLEAQTSEGERSTDDELRFRRMAMLLHDIGHYFMSHAAESAIKQFYKSKALSPVKATGDTIEVPTTDLAYCDHEEAGKIVLENDPELAPILAQYDTSQIAAMFKGALHERYGSLVSSELDADRLDYLMRSSQSTGLPYGHFDREYILQSLVTAPDGRVCIREKAIRAADHFVLCRSFDYLQVVFHKTIVGFEAMLKRCVSYLLEAGVLCLDTKSIESAVSERKWLKYTDSYLLNKLRDIPDDADRITVAMRDRVLQRRPAALMWGMEALTDYDAGAEKSWNRNIGQFFDNPTEEWARNCLYWFRQFQTTEATPFRRSYGSSNKDEEAKEKSIHVLRRDQTYQPLTDCPESFTRYLSNQAYIMARVYYVGPVDEEEETRRAFTQLVERQQLKEHLRV